MGRAGLCCLLLIKKISKEVGKMMHNLQCSIVLKLQLQYSFTDGSEVGFAFTQHIEKTRCYSM